MHGLPVFCFQIAELVATEFFEQGDKERRELNMEPSVSVHLSSDVSPLDGRMNFVSHPSGPDEPRQEEPDSQHAGVLHRCHLHPAVPGDGPASLWGHVPSCPPQTLSPFQTLASMSSSCFPLLDGCQKNRQQWKHLAEEEGLLNGLE